MDGCARGWAMSREEGGSIAGRLLQLDGLQEDCVCTCIVCVCILATYVRVSGRMGSWVGREVSAGAAVACAIRPGAAAATQQ